MRIRKKSLTAGIMILVLILCLLVPAQTAQAYSTGNTYPSRYRNSAKDSRVDSWGYYNRECTSFVAYCLYTRNGFWLNNWYGGVHFGNAKTWLSAARRLGFTVNSTPAVGAVGVSRAGRCGHVVWVKSVHGNTITTDEYNWNNDGRYHTRTTSKYAFKYIHFKDITYKLNVNLTVDGTAKNKGVSGVTYDVTVGGTKKANDVKEYNAANLVGKSYRISDIKVSGCYKLKGKKTYSGTLKRNVTVTIPVTLKHSYDDGVITKEATCTTTGIKTYTCTVCGAKKKKTIAALGHDFETVEEAKNEGSTSTESGDSEDTAADSGTTAASSSAPVCKRCGITDPSYASSAACSVKQATAVTIKLSYTKTTYNGAAQKPSATVTDSNGTVLQEGTDYTIAYTNNKNVGTATVKITGKGQYSGVYRQYFKICPKAPTVASVTFGSKRITVKMSSKVSTTGGQYYQIAFKQSGASKWQSIATSSRQKTIQSVTKGKKYYVKVRAFKTVSGKVYYGSWNSVTLSGKVK